MVEWLTNHRFINPVTGQELGPVPIGTILYPLIIEEEDPSHLARTISILSNAGTAIDSKVWLKGTKIKSNKFLVKYLLARPYHHVETAAWPHDPPSDTQHRQPHGRQKLKQISL